MATIKKKAAATEARETWNSITGTMKVYVKSFSDGGTSVSTSVGKKDGETWVNFYLPVYLSKACDVELEEGINTLDVKNAFLAVRKGKNESVGLQLVITTAEKI